MRDVVHDEHEGKAAASRNLENVGKEPGDPVTSTDPGPSGSTAHGRPVQH
ncbi:MAG: hypothetical protein AVDCRST_MAG03-501 [uncultured Rubrobacteraceae bacterium]|uniref:Uncharacterized protein n=1 Tax=uncultured Rubrobacteraceae bacterium TaxID=349277 RepID=A0A6J4NMT6_9ACTN|nr:MAG: hypothetical protein AVDCRST_MAG03-501 [uncultured Rubrobacteraceae bacterium]